MTRGEAVRPARARGLIAGLLAAALAACAPAAPAAPRPAPSAAPPASAGVAPTAAASAAAATAAPAVERVTVRAGGPGGALNRSLFVGQQKGYYDEQGIDLEVGSFNTMAEFLPLLATGRLDLGYGSTNPSFYNALATGIGVKLITDTVMLRPPGPDVRNATQMVVRADLADTVRGAADLRGRTIAIGNIAGNHSVLLDKILQDQGLGLEDVRLEQIPFADQLVALTNGAVDAAIAIEPLIASAQSRNIATPLIDMGVGYANYPVQVLLYGPELTQKRPEVGQRFLLAHLKTQRYLDAAFRRGVNRDEVIQMLIDNSPVKDRALYDRMATTYPEFNGQANQRAVEVDQDFYVRQGLQREKLDLAAVVDTSFSAYALSALGRLPD